jgi:hypothetical protein
MLLGALWALSAGAARAQDTTQTGAQQQRPQVHVVQPGETLWGLAQQYLGDPLLWPEIYRLNTTVVEDPHWIFPGEELALVPGGEQPPEQPAQPQPTEPPPQPTGPPVPGQPPPDTSQAARAGIPPVAGPPVEAPPPPPPPPPGDASSPTVFAARSRAAVGTRNVGALGGDVHRYRSVRRGEFHAAGFLTENTSFPWGAVLGDAREPASRRRGATSSTRIYQTVELRAPGGASYQAGDSLLVAHLGREVPGWGHVVVPAGIVRVTHVAGDQVLAEVIQQFGRVVTGQVTLPLEAFHDPGFVTPVPVQNGLAAAVIDVRDLHPVPDQQDVVFIDVGKEQGVALGDLFQVLQPQNTVRANVQQPVAVLQIVHVRDRSASGLIVQVYQPGVRPGQPVRLVRKMP